MNGVERRSLYAHDTQHSLCSIDIISQKMDFVKGEKAVKTYFMVFTADRKAVKIKNQNLEDKIMKKALQTFAVWMLTLACCVAFAACGHKHTFSTDWLQDSENHWHACTEKDCAEVSDKAAHVYDNACDADCNVCGATRTVGEHVYDNACDTDCNICGATRTVGEHAYDNACDTDCNVCGATRTVGEHTFVTKHNDTKHWQECSVCNYAKDEGETHSFGTEHDATNHWQACACGYTKDRAEHAFGTEHDATNHWQACACGYKKEQAAHIYDNACDTDCNICGATRTVGEHTFESKHDKTNHWQECSICKYEKDKTAHTYGDWTEKTAADYGVDKVETRTCSKCSYVDEKTIEKSRLEYTGDFYMMIAGVSNVPGKGVSVSGTIARGTIKVGDEVSIGGYEGTLTVQAIEKKKLPLKKRLMAMK